MVSGWKHRGGEAPLFINKRVTGSGRTHARVIAAVHWYERKHLVWNDGYRILLRVEVALLRMSQFDRAVESVLDDCRREVLREMGYTVEENRRHE